MEIGDSTAWFELVKRNEHQNWIQMCHAGRKHLFTSYYALNFLRGDCVNWAMGLKSQVLAHFSGNHWCPVELNQLSKHVAVHHIIPRKLLMISKQIFYTLKINSFLLHRLTVLCLCAIINESTMPQMLAILQWISWFPFK